MQYKLCTLFATVLAATSVSAITSGDIVMNIETITDLSADTDDIVTDLGNNPLSLIPNAGRVLSNFKNIVASAGQSTTMLQGADEDSIESEDDQQDICDAFVDFVKVHQALLMTLIGKNSIIASTPFTAPVAAVLRLIEGGVDELAFALIGFVPSCADEAEMEKKKLDGSISDAIDAFSG